MMGRYNANPPLIGENESDAPLIDNQRRLQVIIAGNASASNSGSSFSQQLTDRNAGPVSTATSPYGVQLVDPGVFNGTPTDYAIAPSTTAFLAVAPDPTLEKVRIQNNSASVTAYIREDGFTPTADNKSTAILPNTTYQSDTPSPSGIQIIAASAIACHVTTWIK